MTHNHIFLSFCLSIIQHVNLFSAFPFTSVDILGNENLYVRTSRGVVPRRTLKPNTPFGTSSDMLPSDTGSRIGMIYVQNPADENKAEMHFIVNGEDQGPCTKDIPYKESELYAVIDIYGTTKQVKIIQIYESTSIDLESFVLFFFFAGDQSTTVHLLVLFVLFVSLQLHHYRVYAATQYCHLWSEIQCRIYRYPPK